jgi:hypothetical protein
MLAECEGAAAMNPRCPLGESLHREWCKALEQHTGYEELAMRLYFSHKNVCYECCGAKVYEMNTQLTPFLFDRATDEKATR